MSYYAEQGSYGGELTRPISQGATEPDTLAGKAKGWLSMLAIVGVALIAMKVTSKKKKK
jgi:hypothetical protein